MADNVNKPWYIHSVPLEARRVIKAYAAQRGLSLGEALLEISKVLK